MATTLPEKLPSLLADLSQHTGRGNMIAATNTIGNILAILASEIDRLADRIDLVTVVAMRPGSTADEPQVSEQAANRDPMEAQAGEQTAEVNQQAEHVKAKSSAHIHKTAPRKAATKKVRK